MLRHFHSRARGVPLWSIVFIAAVTLIHVGCDRRATSDNQPPRHSSDPPREIVISVAASARDAIESLAAQFQSDSGIPVRVNSGPSSALAAQIIEGAPVDLFLSANREWADTVSKANMAAEQVPLLTNELVLIVPRGNRANIHSIRDLAKESISHVALAGEKVPAGIYADQVLKQLGLLEQLTRTGKIVRGQDVRIALSYVEQAEADAGIVYSSDAKGSKNVEVVERIDASLHDSISYVLVLTKAGDANSFAKRFYDFLRSVPAAKMYAEAGFTPLTKSP